MTGARGDLRAATETGEVVADVAVILLDREGQVLAGEQSLLRDQPVEALPVVGQEDVAPDADLLEKSPAGRIITPTQFPGQGSPCHRVVGSPDPNLVFLPFTKAQFALAVAVDRAAARSQVLEALGSAARSSVRRQPR